MILLRGDRFEQAELAFQEALELARSLPHPYGEGRVLHELGVLRRRQGEWEQARRLLAEALAVFQQLGARKDIERTEQELARPIDRVV